MFRGIDKSLRLNAFDAVYVEVIHANWKFYGMDETLGTSDFYPNCGYVQPNCRTDICSHSRSVELFAESLIDDSFASNKCESDAKISENYGKNLENCCGPKAKFGGEPGNINDLNINGVYYFTTKGDAHYGLGKFKKMCWT